MTSGIAHRRARTMWGALLGVATMFALSASVALASPPGNNGTIKIDGIPFDDHPGNEPHVGCIFQVDFYGFDQGDLDAAVLFEAIPPTGTGEDLLTDVVFIGEDDNSGGGSEAGLDASGTYDLTAALQGFTPQPQQGYHVRLTIHADGSQGADTKHKVFWVEVCPDGDGNGGGGAGTVPTPFNGAVDESTGSSGNGGLMLALLLTGGSAAAFVLLRPRPRGIRRD